MRKVIKYFYLICYITILFLIISRAAQSGIESSKESNAVTDVVIEVVDTINPGEVSIKDKYPLESIRHFVRKAIGHYGLFLALGLFSCLLFDAFLKRKIIKHSIIITSGFVIAALSELVQLLADSRGPAFKDVLLDYAGYCTGIAIIYILLIIINSLKKVR